MFDVYAENWYNKALGELSVVSMMQMGLPQLQQRYQSAKNAKTLSKQELAVVTSAVTNLQAFINYKQQEMA